jgi:hypothetical protein
VGEADGSFRQVQLDLPAVIVPGEREGDPSFGSLRKDLRAVGQQDCGGAESKTAERGLQIGLPGVEIVDPRNGKGSLRSLDDPVGIA